MLHTKRGTHNKFNFGQRRLLRSLNFTAINLNSSGSGEKKRLLLIHLTERRVTSRLKSFVHFGAIVRFLTLENFVCFSPIIWNLISFEWTWLKSYRQAFNRIEWPFIIPPAKRMSATLPSRTQNHNRVQLSYHIPTLSLSLSLPQTVQTLRIWMWGRFSGVWGVRNFWHGRATF